MSRAMVSTTLGSSVVAGGRSDGVKSPSLLARWVTSLVQSRERAAAREIAKYIELNGGQLTDSIEREISRRYGRPPF